MNKYKTVKEYGIKNEDTLILKLKIEIMVQALAIQTQKMAMIFCTMELSFRMMIKHYLNLSVRKPRSKSIHN